jgi:hypothetical protein
MTTTKTATKTTTRKPRSTTPKASSTKTTEKKPVAAKVPATNSLPANPFVFEILDLASQQKTKEKKVEVLRNYEDPSLKAIFIWNFDATIVSLLPEGSVPYASTDKQNSFTGTLSDKVTDAVSKMDEIGSKSLGAWDQGQTSIRKEYKMFYNFVKGGNDSLSSLRRETMFINILEGLHPLEAEILILVKDKKLDTKYNITKEIVAEAYPDIKWDNRT